MSGVLFLVFFCRLQLYAGGSGKKLGVLGSQATGVYKATLFTNMHIYI